MTQLIPTTPFRALHVFSSAAMTAMTLTSDKTGLVEKGFSTLSAVFLSSFTLPKHLLPLYTIATAAFASLNNKVEPHEKSPLMERVEQVAHGVANGALSTVLGIISGVCIVAPFSQKGAPKTTLSKSIPFILPVAPFIVSEGFRSLSQRANSFFCIEHATQLLTTLASTITAFVIIPKPTAHTSSSS